MEMVVDVKAEISSRRRVRSDPMRRMQPREGQMGDQEQLLKLAAWYREFADRAGNPMIWECRLQIGRGPRSRGLPVHKLPTLHGSTRALPHGAGVTISRTRMSQDQQQFQEPTIQEMVADPIVIALMR